MECKDDLFVLLCLMEKMCGPEQRSPRSLMGTAVVQLKWNIRNIKTDPQSQDISAISRHIRNLKTDLQSQGRSLISRQILNVRDYTDMVFSLSKTTKTWCLRSQGLRMRRHHHRDVRQET